MMYSKSMVLVVCMPGLLRSMCSMRPGSLASNSARRVFRSTCVSGVCNSGATVNVMKRNPPSGGKYSVYAGGDPLSGNSGARSEPQSLWNAAPGSRAKVRPSTAVSLTKTALPSALCPVVTRRIFIAASLPRALLQILMDESDRHAALTDRGGDSFHRAQPHIATSEDPGGARFEEIGIAAVGPVPGLHHVVPGQDISPIVTSYVRRQPLGFCIGADEDEKAAAVVLMHRSVRAIEYIVNSEV